MVSIQTLSSALWITLIGMGVVFAALLLLWGLMVLMMRLTNRLVSAEEPAAEETGPVIDTAGSPASPSHTHRAMAAAAAAAAVAIAIGMRQAQVTPSNKR